jgi:hypothetical protein
VTLKLDHYPSAEKVEVREWISTPPLSLREAKRRSNRHPASASALSRGGLRRRFDSPNDRYFAQLAAGESIIRPPGITIP